MKLHIVIPTYNRGNFLRETLQSVLPILENKHSVSVFDNASTDDTGDICAQFKDKYQNFKYERRPVNIGGNGNILAGVAATVDLGDMLWILADDDIVDVGAIQELVEYFFKTNPADAPDALVVGACSTRQENSQWPPTADFCRVKESASFWLHASFLPTLILKTESLRGSIQPDLFYVGGCYSQLLLLRHLLAEHSTVAVFPKRIVYRGDNEEAHSQPVWWFVSWHRAIKCFPATSRPLLYRAGSGPFWRLPLKVILQIKMRAACIPSIFEVGYLDVAVCYTGIRRFYFWLFLPLFILPRSLFFAGQRFWRREQSKKEPRSTNRE